MLHLIGVTSQTKRVNREKLLDVRKKKGKLKFVGLHLVFLQDGTAQQLKIMMPRFLLFYLV